MLHNIFPFSNRTVWLSHLREYLTLFDFAFIPFYFYVLCALPLRLVRAACRFYSNCFGIAKGQIKNWHTFFLFSFNTTIHKKASCREMYLHVIVKLPLLEWILPFDFLLYEEKHFGFEDLVMDVGIKLSQPHMAGMFLQLKGSTLYPCWDDKIQVFFFLHPYRNSQSLI